MLFAKRFWPGLQDGSITLTFRTWDRPRVVAGRRYRTRAGVLEVDAIERVRTAAIPDAEITRAGYPDRAALERALRGADEVWRIAFHHAGEDPRIALRDAVPGDEESAALIATLDGIDARAKAGPWTAVTLEAIAARAGRARRGHRRLPGPREAPVQARRTPAEGVGADREPARRVPSLPAWGSRPGCPRATVRQAAEPRSPRGGYTAPSARCAYARLFSSFLSNEGSFRGQAAQPQASAAS